MNDQPVLTIGVECYAGHRGEQTPRALVLKDRRIAVAEVLDAWLAPDHRYFKLKGEDGHTYLVRHTEGTGRWELTMFRAEPHAALTSTARKSRPRQSRKSPGHPQRD